MQIKLTGKDCTQQQGRRSSQLVSSEKQIDYEIEHMNDHTQNFGSKNLLEPEFNSMNFSNIAQDNSPCNPISQECHYELKKVSSDSNVSNSREAELKVSVPTFRLMEFQESNIPIAESEPQSPDYVDLSPLLKSNVLQSSDSQVSNMSHEIMLFCDDKKVQKRRSHQFQGVRRPRISGAKGKLVNNQSIHSQHSNNSNSYNWESSSESSGQNTPSSQQQANSLLSAKMPEGSNQSAKTKLRQAISKKTLNNSFSHSLVEFPNRQIQQKSSKLNIKLNKEQSELIRQSRRSTGDNTRLSFFYPAKQPPELKIESLQDSGTDPVNFSSPNDKEVWLQPSGSLKSEEQEDDPPKYILDQNELNFTKFSDHQSNPIIKPQNANTTKQEFHIQNDQNQYSVNAVTLPSCGPQADFHQEAVIQSQALEASLNPLQPQMINNFVQPDNTGLQAYQDQIQQQIYRVQNENILQVQILFPNPLSEQKDYQRDQQEPLLPAQVSDKPTLVLDLDETLVHCDNHEFVGAHLRFSMQNDIIELCSQQDKSLQGVLPQQQSKFLNNEHFKSENDSYIYVAFRPYLIEFLTAVSQFYEVVLFTASEKNYADKVVSIFDPSGQFFAHRLYRDSCTPLVKPDGSGTRVGGFVKDLRRLGRPLEQTIIVDNSIHAFALQISNGIPIPSFFGQSWDTELYQLWVCLRPYLQSSMLESLLSVEDMRDKIDSFWSLWQKIWPWLSPLVKKNQECLNKKEPQSNQPV